MPCHTSSPQTVYSMIPALVQMSNRWCPEPKIDHWPSWQSTIRARNELLRRPTASSGENDGLKVKRVKPWNVDVPTLRHNFLTSYWKLLHALQGMADPLQYSYSRTVQALEAHFHVIVTSFVAKHTIQKKSHPVILGTIDTPIPIHETKSSRVAGITIEGKSRHGSHVIMRTAHLAQSKNWHVAFYLETSGKKTAKHLRFGSLQIGRSPMLHFVRHRR